MRRDQVRPVGNPKQEESEESRASSAQFFAKQINIWKRQQTKQYRSNFEAKERKPCAEHIRNQQGPIHLNGFASGITRKKMLVLPCVIS